MSLTRKLSLYRFLIILVIVVGFSTLATSQTVKMLPRKATAIVKPVYPELARHMNLTAAVKVQVTVAANGQVIGVLALGGHPLFVAPSLEAAKKWRYETFAESTTEAIEFHFSPGEN
jgi:outer membrane biosynthesis protein TonB